MEDSPLRKFGVNLSSSARVAKWSSLQAAAGARKFS